MTPAFPQWNSPLVYVPDPNKHDSSGLNPGQLSPQWLTFFQWVWSLRTTIEMNIEASGSDNINSTELQSDWSQVTSISVANPGVGVRMGPGWAAADTIVVQNVSGSGILVYPIPKARIDSLAVDAGYSLADGKMQVFRVFSDTQIYSMQLG